MPISIKSLRYVKCSSPSSPGPVKNLSISIRKNLSEDLQLIEET